MEGSMSDTVVIKGTKSGIILVLDASTEYDVLKQDVAAKFKASAAFLGEAQKAVTFQGKALTDEQKMEIIKIIEENCRLSIVCIMENDEKLEQAFKNSIERQMIQQDYSTGQFFKGNLRSGQVLDVETSIIIIGDVKAGAKVISKGNVIILGSLKGNVYAGSSGNQNAFVVALDMDPMQIRIADTIARSPDKPKKRQPKETKIAFWEEGNIYIETLDKDVIGDIRL
jgi:septum site-determining protein MinC